MKDDRIYLGHIRDAIEDIEQYAAVGHDVFLTDRMRQDAVIRKLEIIGEAVKNLSAQVRQARPEKAVSIRVFALRFHPLLESRPEATCIFARIVFQFSSNNPTSEGGRVAGLKTTRQVRTTHGVISAMFAHERLAEAASSRCQSL